MKRVLAFAMAFSAMSPLLFAAGRCGNGETEGESGAGGEPVRVVEIPLDTGIRFFDLNEIVFFGSIEDFRKGIVGDLDKKQITFSAIGGMQPIDPEFKEKHIGSYSTPVSVVSGITDDAVWYAGCKGHYVLNGESTLGVEKDLIFDLVCKFCPEVFDELVEMYSSNDKIWKWDEYVDRVKKEEPYLSEYGVKRQIVYNLLFFASNFDYGIWQRGRKYPSKVFFAPDHFYLDSIAKYIIGDEGIDRTKKALFDYTFREAFSK